MFGRRDSHSASAVVEAHGNCILPSNGGNLAVYLAIVRHCAGHFGTTRVERFSGQNLRYGCGGIAGIRVFGAGAGNGGTGLVVRRDSFGQLVRGYGVCGKVQLRFLADNHLIHVFIGHCSIHLL